MVDDDAIDDGGGAGGGEAEVEKREDGEAPWVGTVLGGWRGASHLNGLGQFLWLLIM